MKERSLVAFTLLGQAAAGLALAAWAVGQAAGTSMPPETARLLTLPVWVGAAAFSILALLASLFHLGSPRAAWRSLGNLRRSWLSREILSGLLFTGTVTLAAFLYWSSADLTPIRSAIAGIVALLGLALVFAMAQVYHLRTVAAWNGPSTLLAFFFAALLLGALGAAVLMPLGMLALHPGALFVLFTRSDLGPGLLNSVALAGLALLGLRLVSVVYEQQSNLPNWFRPALLLAAAFSLAAANNLPGVTLWGDVILSLLAFGLAFVSEAAGRVSFYARREAMQL